MLFLLLVALLGGAIYFLLFRSKRERSKQSLAEKLVLVTGGGSGIGAELSYRLAVQERAVVLVVDINEEGLQATRKRIEAEGGDCSVFPCDVSKQADVAALIEFIESRLRPLDVLVNNAGIAVKKPFLQCSTSEMEQTFRVNVFAHFYLLHAVLPSMIERGSGHVVQVGSTMDSLAIGSLAGYTASKWAVAGFTESLRHELSETLVGLTLVRPWLTSTPLFDSINFWSHPWIALLAPPTTVVEVAEAIIDGIALNHATVTVPGRMEPLLAVFHLLPSRFRVRLVEALGLDKLI